MKKIVYLFLCVIMLASTTACNTKGTSTPASNSKNNSWVTINTSDDVSGQELSDASICCIETAEKLVNAFTSADIETLKSMELSNNEGVWDFLKDITFSNVKIEKIEDDEYYQNFRVSFTADKSYSDIIKSGENYWHLFVDTCTPAIFMPEEYYDEYLRIKNEISTDLSEWVDAYNFCASYPYYNDWFSKMTEKSYVANDDGSKNEFDSLCCYLSNLYADYANKEYVEYVDVNEINSYYNSIKGFENFDASKSNIFDSDGKYYDPIKGQKPVCFCFCTDYSVNDSSNKVEFVIDYFADNCQIIKCRTIKYVVEISSDNIAHITSVETTYDNGYIPSSSEYALR